MNESERHRVIVETLKEQPFSTVKDLTAKLDTSAATIRRDIAKLHEAGMVRKVFGGIATTEGQVEKDRLSARSFEESRMLAVAQKRAIAVEAEKLCRDGDSIIINGGSTCFLLASRLATRSLRVYTHSMPVAAILGERGIGQLVVAGGELYRESGVLYSQHDDPSPFYASKLFIGAQGVGPEGVTESNPMLARAVERLLDQVDELVVLADSRKFDVRARHVAVSLARISVLVTDDGLRDDDARMLEEAGVRLLVAPSSPG
jgi:DeoR family ulaG and ulaABCDEF operon transcriptional repressor